MTSDVIWEVLMDIFLRFDSAETSGIDSNEIMSKHAWGERMTGLYDLHVCCAIQVTMQLYLYTVFLYISSVLLHAKFVLQLWINGLEFLLRFSSLLTTQSAFELIYQVKLSILVIPVYIWCELRVYSL